MADRDVELTAKLAEVRGYPLIGRGYRGREINSLIGKAIDAIERLRSERDAAVAAEREGCVAVIAEIREERLAQARDEEDDIEGHVFRAQAFILRRAVTLIRDRSP